MTREEYKDELIAGVVNYALTVKQAINAAYKHADETNPNGWRPASELPTVDENGNSPELIAITWDGYLMRVYFHQESEEYSFWVESDDWNKQVKYGVNVKWWSYPPEEE